jgi:hypothetical protein
MRVRWTADAADDLERICDYIAEERSDSARRVSSPPLCRHLRNSRGTDSRLANPPRRAALAERTLAPSMLPRITITRTWSDDDVWTIRRAFVMEASLDPSARSVACGAAQLGDLRGPRFTPVSPVIGFSSGAGARTELVEADAEARWWSSGPRTSCRGPNPVPRV